MKYLKEYNHEFYCEISGSEYSSLLQKEISYVSRNNLSILKKLFGEYNKKTFSSSPVPLNDFVYVFNISCHEISSLFL